MGGYSGMYLIGKPGGYMGADGINPIQIQLWTWVNERPGLSVHYVDDTIKPIGKVRFVQTDGADEVLDACIAFHPAHFRTCPSLAAVEAALANEEICHVDQIAAWNALREEARPKLKELSIWWANFEDWPGESS